MDASKNFDTNTVLMADYFMLLPGQLLLHAQAFGKTNFSKSQETSSILKSDVR